MAELAQRNCAFVPCFFGIVLSACSAPMSPRVHAARPAAGDATEVANPGQTACEAATDRWPAIPDLDDRIDRLRVRGNLPGVSACIIKEGRVAWCGGYGSTKGEGGTPVTPETPFLMASVSKLVTATAAGQLVDQGKLRFEDDVDRHLPFSAAHPRSARPIQLRHALAHTAGIGDNYWVMDDYYAVDRDPTQSLMSITSDYFDPDGDRYNAKRNFLPVGPGRTYRYSNMGYALVGAVVESAGGQEFAEATAASIFEPLGLNNTSWRLADFDQDTLAEPTRYRNGNWQGQGHYTFADYPNGGLRSSAHDMACLMATFARGGELYGTRILETETLYEMMRTAYPRLDAGQGLGWYYEDVGERKLWIGHSGAESGVATDTFMRQDGSLGFVVLANGDWGGTGAIFAIEDALLNHAAEL